MSYFKTTSTVLQHMVLTFQVYSIIEEGRLPSGRTSLSEPESSLASVMTSPV